MVRLAGFAVVLLAARILTAAPVPAPAPVGVPVPVPAPALAAASAPATDPVEAALARGKAALERAELAMGLAGNAAANALAAQRDIEDRIAVALKRGDAAGAEKALKPLRTAAREAASARASALDVAKGFEACVAQGRELTKLGETFPKDGTDRAKKRRLADLASAARDMEASASAASRIATALRDRWLIPLPVKRSQDGTP